MDVKRCSKCGETKPVDMFAGNGREKDGLHRRCRACVGASHEAQLEKARLRHNPNPSLQTELRREARQIAKTIQIQSTRIEVKKCRKCGETKPIEMFAGNGREKDGLNPRCKACIGAKHEARLKKARLYHDPNPSPIAQLRRENRKTAKRNQDIFIRYKQCNKCGEIKPVEMFSGNGRQKDRLNPRCKACIGAKHEGRRDKARQIYESNHFADNQEARAVQERRRARRERYDTHRKSTEEYGEAIREALEKQAQMLNELKHIFVYGKQTQHQRRQAWLQANGGSHTKAEIKALCEAQNHQCAYCKRQVKLTEDHIIPLMQGGRDDIANICMACRRCNTQKNARTPEQWVKRWYLEAS